MESLHGRVLSELLWNELNVGTGHTRVSPAQRVSPPMTITLNRVPYIGKGGTTPYVFGVPF